MLCSSGSVRASSTDLMGSALLGRSRKLLLDSDECCTNE